MNTNFMNIFVLGAGASVDYGLPVWSELGDLLIQNIEENKATILSADVSNLVGELGQIGKGKKYRTVDEMISKFSRETTDFAETTAAWFKEVKTILEQRVKPESVGWIETFVRKNNLEILLHNGASNNPSVFINFNYDTLLLMKIVEFYNGIYVNTANPKKAEWIAKNGLAFEKRFQYCATDIFHPHGVLYLFDKDEIKIGENTYCYPTTKTFINSHTSGDGPPVNTTRTGEDNAISCHDAYEHFTFIEIKKRISSLARGGEGATDIRLILLGVGPDSLAFNLNKIFNEQTFAVSQVYYTCTNEDEEYIYQQYLNRFQATSVRYENCQELVEENIFIPFN